MVSQDRRDRVARKGVRGSPDHWANVDARETVATRAIRVYPD
jgi:hypothetical protein